MKRKLLNYNNFVILLFLITCLVTIHFHEKWFDEAQSWLLARDLSFSGIFKQMVYEGHSCLYFYYLKVLIMIGIPYKLIGYFSIFWGVVVAVLVLYKSPFNKYINTLLLFSPAFIYHCPIFARPYVISLLLFLLICILYKDRYKHPFLFGIIIFLFINTHILTIIFIGSLMLIEIYEFFFKDKDYFKERVIMGCMSLISVIFFAIQLLGSFNKRTDILDGFDIRVLFSSITNTFSGLFLDNVFSFVFVMVLLLLIAKKIIVNKKILFILLFNTISYLIFASLCNLYPSKVIYIMMYFLFGIWLFYEEEKKECNKLFIIVLLFSCIASFDYIKNDINGEYSTSVSISNYLKKDDRNKIKVLTFSYDPQVVVFLDDRYVFTNFISDKEYTFCLYDLNFSNVNGDIKEYIIDNSIDYLVVTTSFRKDEINKLVKEGFLSIEVQATSYSSSSSDFVYKVN